MEQNKSNTGIKLRSWYCEEVIANLTFVHCPSLSFPEVIGVRAIFCQGGR